MSTLRSERPPPLRRSDSLMYDAVSGPCSPHCVYDGVPQLPAGRVLVLEKQQDLFWQGDAAAFFYQVEDGMVCLSSMLPDGRRQILRFCMKGDIFGLSPRGNYDCTATALIPSAVVAHRVADLDRPDDRSNPLATAVLRTIYRDLVAAQEQVLMLGRKSAVERLASFLLSLAKRVGVEQGGGVAVCLPMRHGDIGDHLGLAPETICRLLTGFKKRGILADGKPQWIVILDEDALADVAEAGWRDSA